MRNLCVLLLVLVVIGSIGPAEAQISASINAPGISINLTAFPNLVVVPDYPVYYAPSVSANYFFYDGFYWVFNVADGQWYSSSWYDGPWVFVDPIYVPQPLLVIPLRYYRVRPVYWQGWALSAPPEWGQHWGNAWEARRAGWDRWDRSRAHAAAPLPAYQRDYPRNKYPSPSQQVTIANQRYKYQPQDAQVQQERAAIFRQESSGGSRATVIAERAAQAPSSARSPRPETARPPAAPRQQPPAVEREQPPRGSEPQRVVPQPNAPREQAAPQQAPRRERPQETAPPPAAPRQQGPAVERGPQPEPGRVAPQPTAPRQQAAPQQAPRREQPPETAPAPAAPRQQAPAVERAPRPEPQRAAPQPAAPRQQAAPQQAPHAEHPQAAPQQHPAQQQQPERGAEGHREEAPGK